MTTYTSQPDETDGIDTWLSQFTATTNHGTGDYIELGEDNRAAGAACRPLIKLIYHPYLRALL